MPKQKVASLDKNKYKCGYQNCNKSYPRQDSLCTHQRRIHKSNSNDEQPRKLIKKEHRPAEVKIDKIDILFNQKEVSLKNLCEETFIDLFDQIKHTFAKEDVLNVTLNHYVDLGMDTQEVRFSNLKAATRDYCYREVAKLAEKYSLEKVLNLVQQLEVYHNRKIHRHEVNLIWDLVHNLIPSLASIIYLDLACMLVTKLKGEMVDGYLRRKMEEFRSEVYNPSSQIEQCLLSDNPGSIEPCLLSAKLEGYVDEWLSIYSKETEKTTCLRKHPKYRKKG